MNGLGDAVAAYIAGVVIIAAACGAVGGIALWVIVPWLFSHIGIVWN